MFVSHPLPSLVLTVKVIIRGDKLTGKSTMLEALKGNPFNPKHQETDEIKVFGVIRF